MKKFICILLIFAMALTLCACTPREAQGTLNAMDTFMDFKLYGADSDNALEAVKSTVKALDKSLSTTDAKSEIYALNKSGNARLSDQPLELVNRALELCGELDGALDISVYPLVEEWGFISGDYKVPDKKTISELLTKVDYKKIKVDNNAVTLAKDMKIDLGALAKGYAADKCREVIEDKGISSAIMNFGGTIAVSGAKPAGGDWRVGITDPDNSSTYFGLLNCHDTVVATSGGYERFFEKDGKKYIHIIDPKTGFPVDNGVKSVTVVSKNGVLADALSTALYVMGAERAIGYYKIQKAYDFIILTDDNKLYITDGIADSFTLSDGYDYEIIKVK